jgi:hypothetical protein
MWFPGKRISEDIRDLFITALNDEEVKKEFTKRFEENMQSERSKNRTEHTARVDSSRSRYRGPMQSYEELTSGNVNLQARMAASGYDVYGRTILSGHENTSHDNLYRRMKNKIQYGRQPDGGYRNRGESARK